MLNKFTALDPRIEIVPEVGCWLWMRKLHKTTGYGEVCVSSMGKKKSTVAHRPFYEQAYGPVPVGVVLDHIPSCRTRSCVNPDHLRPVTQRENLMAEGSLALAKINAQKTQCPKCGGDYTKDRSRNTRFCRPCQAIYYAQWRRERRRSA